MQGKGIMGFILKQQGDFGCFLEEKDHLEGCREPRDERKCLDWGLAGLASSPWMNLKDRANGIC